MPGGGSQHGGHTAPWWGTPSLCASPDYRKYATTCSWPCLLQLLRGKRFSEASLRNQYRLMQNCGRLPGPEGGAAPCRTGPPYPLQRRRGVAGSPPCLDIPSRLQRCRYHRPPWLQRWPGIKAPILKPCFHVSKAGLVDQQCSMPGPTCCQLWPSVGR